MPSEPAGSAEPSNRPITNESEGSPQRTRTRAHLVRLSRQPSARSRHGNAQLTTRAESREVHNAPAAVSRDATTDQDVRAFWASQTRRSASWLGRDIEVQHRAFSLHWLEPPLGDAFKYLDLRFW